MEDYKIKEKIRKISAQIERLIPVPNWRNSLAADDNAIHWDASGFVAKLLEVSKIGPRIIGLEDLQVYFSNEDFRIVCKFFKTGILRTSFGVLDGKLLGYNTLSLDLSSEENVVIAKVKEFHRNQLVLLVDASDLERLHQTFADLFSKMPSIQKLVDQQFLEKSPNGYEIQPLFQRKPGNDHVYPQALARFWAFLLEKNFLDDVSRFAHWHSRAVCLERWESITEYLVGAELGQFKQSAWKALNTDRYINSGPITIEYWGRNQLFKESAARFSSLYRYSKFRDNFEYYSTYSDHSGEYRVARDLLRSLLYLEKRYSHNNFERHRNEVLKFKTHPWLSMTIAKEFPWHELPYLIEEEDLVPFLFEKLKELDEAIFHAGYPDLLDDDEVIERIQAVTKIQILLWNLFLKVRAQAIITADTGKPLYSDVQNAELIAEILLSHISECSRLIESPASRQFLIPLYRSRIDNFFLTLEQTISEFDGRPLIIKAVTPIINEIDRHMKNRGRASFQDFSYPHITILFRIINFLKINSEKNSQMFDSKELVLQVQEIIAHEHIYELTRVFNDSQHCITWSGDIKELDDLDWWLLIPEENDKSEVFDEFIYPVDFTSKVKNSKVELTEYPNLGYYSIVEEVRTWIPRIRLHLKLLSKLQLSILSADEKKAQYKITVDSALSKLLVTHCRYELDAGRLNLFDAQLEDLSILVASVLDRMSPDLAMDTLKVLMKDVQSPTFLFSISGNLKSNAMQLEMQKFLIQSWDHDNIKEYLENQYWLDPLLNVVRAMSSLAENDAIRERLERLVEYIDKERSIKFKSIARKDWIQLKFPLLLRIALLRNDQKKIEDQTLSDSDRRLFQAEELQRLFSVRKFYLGLFWIEKDAKKAYSLFDELVKENHSWKLVAALNRFAAQIEIAGKEISLKNQRIGYERGIQEWESALNGDLVPEYIRIPVTSNLLHCYLKLNRDSDFETELNKLDSITQLSKELLPIITDFDLKQRNVEKIKFRIQEAKLFHSQNLVIPDWLEELQKECENNVSIKLPIGYSDNGSENNHVYLRNVLYEIAKKPFFEFSQIVESHSTDYYLLKRVLECLVELRNRRTLIRSPERTAHKEVEPALNDWLGAFMRQRLTDIDVSVEVDPPQGKSTSSTTHPGKPDIIVRRSGSEIAVIECLWMENDPVGHAEKIHDYSSSNLRILVVYCKNSEEFDWERYEKKITGAGKGFIKFEKVNTFEYHAEIFKVRKAIHDINGSLIPVYHVLVLADFAVWQHSKNNNDI